MTNHPNRKGNTTDARLSESDKSAAELGATGLRAYIVNTFESLILHGGSPNDSARYRYLVRRLASAEGRSRAAVEREIATCVENQED